MWTLLESTHCLDELRDDKDKEKKNWVLYAAEHGNLGLFFRLGYHLEDIYSQLEAEDVRGWNGFMYAARGRGAHSSEFLRKLRKLCFSRPEDRDRLRAQLTRIATGDGDDSTMLLHAAIGGRESYALVCEMMREAGCDAPSEEGPTRGAALLSWAAEGGDVDVLTVVAGGIKASVRQRCCFRRPARRFRAPVALSFEADCVSLLKCAVHLRLTKLCVGIPETAYGGG